MHILELALASQPVIIAQHCSIVSTSQKIETAALGLTLLGAGAYAVLRRGGGDVVMLHSTDRRRGKGDSPIGKDLLSGSILNINVSRHALNI
jgi:hypothetical protein